VLASFDHGHTVVGIDHRVSDLERHLLPFGNQLSLGRHRRSRWRIASTALEAEIAELDNVIKTVLDTIAAPLLPRHGVGYETAGSLLCTAGDNPDRLATQASFAFALRHPTRAHLDRQLQATKAQPRR
jgi:hypothetical protein